MNGSNKVVLKINYQGAEEISKKTSGPQLVTEWHVKRILMVFILLIFIIFLVGYLYSAEPESPIEQKRMPERQMLSKPTENIEPKPDNEMQEIDQKITFNESDVITEAIKNDEIEEVPLVSNETNSSQIPRALLTSGLKNKEPIDNIQSSITVNKNNATAVYYFTELIDMKDQELTHHWLWENQVIYKKTFNVLGNRWRATTSKLITFSKSGFWVVRLVNEKDDVLNEIKFEVIQELE